ncbi:hypothetical protein Leryth_007647 [Lithospermum erythrorhizon]|nr:hypothetical protein Leryth_007647 [Lithospermum erythrorhizon]
MHKKLPVLKCAVLLNPGWQFVILTTQWLNHLRRLVLIVAVGSPPNLTPERASFLASNGLMHSQGSYCTIPAIQDEPVVHVIDAISDHSRPLAAGASVTRKRPFRALKAHSELEGSSKYDKLMLILLRAFLHLLWCLQILSRDNTLLLFILPVSLASTVLPEFLVNLLPHQGNESKNFHTLLHPYNNNFTCSSLKKLLCNIEYFLCHGLYIHNVMSIYVNMK